MTIPGNTFLKSQIFGKLVAVLLSYHIYNERTFSTSANASLSIKLKYSLNTPKILFKKYSLKFQLP